jgi:hypothetical protein
MRRGDHHGRGPNLSVVPSNNPLNFKTKSASANIQFNMIKKKT